MTEQDFQGKYEDLPLRYEDLPLEPAPGLVPNKEDKEAEYVELGVAVKKRVDEFLEGVKLSVSEEIQHPDKFREVEVSSAFTDVSRMNLSDLGSNGVITVEGNPDLIDADVFVNNVHMASRTSIVGGSLVYSETASRHTSEVVLTGELSSIHQLKGKADVYEVSDDIQTKPRMERTDITITVFTFKDGRIRTLYPHSAFGQPFPEDQKIPVARQIGVEI